jgi:hypothetical protein
MERIRRRSTSAYNIVDTKTNIHRQSTSVRHGTYVRHVDVENANVKGRVCLHNQRVQAENGNALSDEL